MSYGAIPTAKSSSFNQEVFQGEVNSKLIKLKILAIVLGVTLLGCVIAVNLGNSGPSQSQGATLLTAAADANRTARRESRIRQTGSDPVVTITLGKLKGVVLKSRAGRDYYGFYNVPYGKPPVGNLRFLPPEPAESWTGTKDCTRKGSKCIQKAKTNPNMTEGSEDCLHTNIYTPKIPGRFRNRNPNLPVIVYFFGGGFILGTANDFSAEYFMDEEVVIVIVESRVGALGYLNTGDLEATGNQGLKDQNLALRWVQANIHGFGGDKTRVVAFGTSSGAMCAHAHLLSPMSKGLFSGIMSFSGSMLAPNTFAGNPRRNAELLGESLKCPDLKNSKALLECLRNATAEEIEQNQPLIFSPTIEALPSDGNLSSVFLPDTPMNLLKSGKVNKVPWITGVNSAEHILMSYGMLLDLNQVSKMNNNWEGFMGPTLGLGNDPDSLNISRTLHDFYFGNKSVGVDTRYNLTNLLSDRSWIHPAKTGAFLQAQYSPVYTYYLTKEANVSFADPVTQYFDPPYGVSHADEVQYFFLRPGYPHIPLDSPWGNFSVMIVKLWVSFAANGAPGIDSEATWPSVPKDWSGFDWYNLDDTPKMVEPFNERMKLWNSFPIDTLYKQE